MGMESYVRFKIAGIHYLNDEKAKDLVATLNPGDKLTLERDTDNFYDEWAMEVYSGYTMIGYVESGQFKNEKLCHLKRKGLISGCVVDNVVLNEDKTPIVYAKAFYLNED